MQLIKRKKNHEFALPTNAFPMQYFPGNKATESLVTGYDIPEPLQKWRTPFSLPTYCQGKFGSYLAQKSKWGGLEFEQIRFFMPGKAILFALNPRATIYLVYPFKGKADMKVKADTWKIEKNVYQLLYLPKGRHKLWFEQGEHVWFLVQLNISYLRELAGKFATVYKLLHYARSLSNNGFRLRVGSINHRIRQLVFKITASTHESTERKLYLQARVKELLSLCARHLESPLPEPAHFEKNKETFAAYIENGLGDSITISAMAKDFNMSPAVLKKLFRILFNKPIHRYIQEQRLRAAMKLIVTTKLSVYTIALRMGFSDPPHFIKCFKARFGYTPQAFRKRNQEDQ